MGSETKKEVVMKVKRLVEFPKGTIRTLKQIAKDTNSIGITDSPDGMIIKYRKEKDADAAYPELRKAVGRNGQVQQGRIAKSAIFIYYF